MFLNILLFKVTEQEIFHGIINNSESSKRSFVFIREFENYKEIIANRLREKKLKKYFELNSNGELDEEINNRIIELQNKIATILPENKIFRFKVNIFKIEIFGQWVFCSPSQSKFI